METGPSRKDVRLIEAANWKRIAREDCEMSDQSSWKKRFENPAVLAASVASLTTFCIGAVTASSAWWTARVQSEAAVEKAKIEAKADDDKSQRETKRALVISAVASGSPELKLQTYLNAGILDDQDCKLRILILHYSPDCKPPP